MWLPRWGLNKQKRTKAKTQSGKQDAFFLTWIASGNFPYSCWHKWVKGRRSCGADDPVSSFNLWLRSTETNLPRIHNSAVSPDHIRGLFIPGRRGCSHVHLIINSPAVDRQKANTLHIVDLQYVSTQVYTVIFRKTKTIKALEENTGKGFWTLGWAMI